MMRSTLACLLTVLLCSSALGQGRDFTRVCYQIDVGSADERQVECQDVMDAGADPCFAGVAVGNGEPVGYALKEADFDIDLNSLDLSDGMHSVSIWFETTGGEPSEVSTDWFCVVRPPAPTATMEYAIVERTEIAERTDDGQICSTKIADDAWDTVTDWEEDGIPCPESPERSWDLPSLGLESGTYVLAVRLLDSAGQSVSQRCTVFQVPGVGEFDPPTLRPDLPGEIDDNNVDDDGDGLVDAGDPEFATIDYGPSITLTFDRVCADGSFLFSSETLVDPETFFPGDLRVGRAYVVLPVPGDRFDRQEHSCRVELSTVPPVINTPDPDPASRHVDLSWTNRPEGYPGGIDIRFDRPSDDCKTPPPSLPGAHLEDGHAEEFSTELTESGALEVAVLGWRTEKVAFWTSPAPLSVPPFCLEDLQACVEDGGIQLRWRELECDFVGQLEIYRATDPTPIHEVTDPLAFVDVGDTEYVDDTVQPGSVYSYQVRVEVEVPVPGTTGSNSVVASLAGPSCSGGSRPGDCNGDGLLDISDPICLLGYLFRGDPSELPCGAHTSADLADIILLDFNDDGGIDISDAIAMLRHLYVGGEPHPLGKECVEIAGCPPACGE